MPLPNDAKLIGSKRPFIVMEYVEGLPITVACTSRNLRIRQRVELFRSVCSAVHYAHQKLIIHRDIKPDNVLVTPEGTVKLIDFGVAKPMVPESFMCEPPPTESSYRLMTPDYASPEQLLGKQLTAASDIYSLGVLLFELLASERPYNLRGRFQQTRNGWYWRRSDSSRVPLRLADIYTFLGDIRQATAEYQNGVALALPLWQAKPADPARTRMLTMIYAGMGDAALSTLRPDKSLKNYLEAFKVFGDRASGDEEHDLLLTDLYLRRAAALNELGDQQETLRETQKAIALADTLVHEFPSSIQNRRELMLAYQRMVLTLSGRSFLNLGESTQAQIYARKSLAIAELLAVNDSKNTQANFDLAAAMTSMGDAYHKTMPATGTVWYRKSIALTKRLAPRYGAEARYRIVVREEALADVLSNQPPQRLILLNEANLRRELADTSLHGKLTSDGLVLSTQQCGTCRKQSLCSATERQLGTPLMKVFNLSSSSLLVLRELGLCLEAQGNVQRRLAASLGPLTEERRMVKAAARKYYQSSAEIWADGRGAM